MKSYILEIINRYQMELCPRQRGPLIIVMDVLFLTFSPTPNFWRWYLLLILLYYFNLLTNKVSHTLAYNKALPEREGKSPTKWNEEMYLPRVLKFPSLFLFLFFLLFSFLTFEIAGRT